MKVLVLLSMMVVVLFSDDFINAKKQLQNFNTEFDFGTKIVKKHKKAEPIIIQETNKTKKTPKIPKVVSKKEKIKNKIDTVIKDKNISNFLYKFLEK